MIGKPNLMMTFSGVEQSAYVMNQAANMTSKEFVMSTETLSDLPKFSGNSEKSYHNTLIKKLKESIKNEYNRTEIEQRGV